MSDFQNNVTVDYKFAKKIYLAILFFTGIWLILIFLAPFLSESNGFFKSVSTFIYLFFSKVCHQDDVRSFHLFGHNLGVCSRCVWVYTGFFIGTVIYPLKYKLNNINPPSVFFLFIAVFILMTDVILDSAGILYNTFFTRSMSGFIIGFTLTLYIIPGFIKFFYEVQTFLKNKANA